MIQFRRLQFRLASGAGNPSLSPPTLVLDAFPAPPECPVKFTDSGFEMRDRFARLAGIAPS